MDYSINNMLKYQLICIKMKSHILSKNSQFYIEEKTISKTEAAEGFRLRSEL